MVSTALAWSRIADSASAPRRSVLVAIALIGCAAAACCFALALTSDRVAEPGLQAALIDWMLLPYVLGGLVAWWRRPDSRFGLLMIAAGFVIFLPSLSWTDAGVLHTIGQAFDLMPAAIFLHLSLAYPSGRLESGFERTLVAAGYVTALGLELVGMLLGGFGPNNVLEVTTEPAAAEAVLRFQLAALSAFSVVGLGVLVVRRRRTGRPLRLSLAVLIESFALGLVMIAVLFLTALLGGPAFETIRRATFVVLGLAPVVFLVGLLRARLARSAVGELVVELREDPGPAGLRAALARALRDPSLALVYWLPEYARWADLSGRPVEQPGDGDGRVTTVIQRDGARVAALVHDRSLEDEPELLSSVTAAAGIALENGRLQAELRARLVELAGSRARVIAAGQKERQRLERNLHDGAQQRLIALSLELGLLEERLAGDTDATRRLGQARCEIASSLAELRDVASGIHPAVVSGHGLAVALEDLAARAPLPVRLSVALEDRLPEALEVAAFYVVSESLANIGKHAQAGSATINVARTDGVVVIEVVDDGIGGADTERGTGLRGIADRVEALGGRLRVWTSERGGTRVRAEIPCAS
jgi:signal transduction histidine kinase